MGIMRNQRSFSVTCLWITAFVQIFTSSCLGTVSSSVASNPTVEESISKLPATWTTTPEVTPTLTAHQVTRLTEVAYTPPPSITTEPTAETSEPEVSITSMDDINRAMDQMEEYPQPDPIFCETNPQCSELLNTGYVIGSVETINLTNNDVIWAILFSPGPDGSNHPTYEEKYVLGFFNQTNEEYKLISLQTLKEYYQQEYVEAIDIAVIANWEVFRWNYQIMSFFPIASQEKKELLNIEFAASDINQNGFPEFTVAIDNGSRHNVKGYYQFYEIRNQNAVVALSTGLPGIFTSSMIFSDEPRTFYLEDVSHPYDLWTDIESFWILEWKNDSFKDVSIEHKDLFSSIITDAVTKIESGYGQPFDDYPAEKTIFSILVNSEKIDQREIGADLVITASNLENWPGTSEEYSCWLQYITAEVSIDLLLGEPYWDYISIGSGNPAIDYWYNSESVQNRLIQLENQGYDLSFCMTLIKDN